MKPTDIPGAAGWRKVRRKCGLDDTEVEMARRLALTPEKVLRMIPSKNEPWKDGPPLRIRRLYDRRFGSPLNHG